MVLGLKQRDADVEGSAVVRALAAAVATSATFKSMVIENQMFVTPSPFNHLHCFILPPLTQGGTSLKRTTMIYNVKANKNRNTLKR